MAKGPRVLGTDVQVAALLLTEHAGLLLAAVLDRHRQAELRDQLRAALAQGEEVNRAIGVVMAQRGCPPEEALGVLHRTAAELGVPL